MTIRALRDAVMQSLALELPGAVFKSYSASKDTQRYAVVFVSKSAIQRARFSAGQTRDVYTVTVHSVGMDEDLAFWVQERVDRLTGRKLIVPGRSVWPVEYITGRQPALDDDGPKPLWFAVTQFDVISDPM